ncbi:beta transducin [Blastocladiella emersonii ATCC 22665]|nr:beta transducin [Blastocladiella emersonii ATCC 22665]
MVKAYLRYAPGNVFGVIASTTANIASDATGRLAVSPALQSVVVWDTKKAESVTVWHEEGNTAEVSCIARAPDGTTYAAGYTDGTIRVWSLTAGTTPLHWFQGHQSAVTALTFDPQGTTLASGSQDTNIVLWDLVAGAGKVRLTGHKDQITSLVFVPSGSALRTAAEQEDMAAGAEPKQQQKVTDRKLHRLLKSLPAAHILSASKDTTIKAWDLTTNACVETVVTHRSEVWDMALTHMWQDAPEVLTLVSAGDELKVHKVNADHLDQILATAASASSSAAAVPPPPTGDAVIAEADEPLRAIVHAGDLKKVSSQRSVSLKLSPCHTFVIAACVDTQIQVLRVLSPEEAKSKLTRRRKRLQDRAAKARAEGKEPTAEELGEPVLAIGDLISPLFVALADAKVRSVDVCPSLPAPRNTPAKADAATSPPIFTFLASLANNSINAYAVTKDEVQVLSTVDMHGHRGDIRALALSQDDELLASAGTNLVKVWNVRNAKCIRTMDAGYALSVAFVPGGKYLLVGTKSGELQIFSLASSALVESIKAHDSAIWSIALCPDKTGFVTGSADHQVKFWDFALVREEANRLTAIHTRTLKLSDEVLAVAISPNQKVVAVSLLDATVKVFYYDSLKFSLSLYGHKLPVLCMDISSDNTLILTGSADKNIKVWGLDFGDCHRSLFAHGDAIMQAKFVWGTHYAFTCSKDKTIKYWDLDKYENISTLAGHTSEVWALAIGKFGNFVASASHDRSIRMWEKTDEQLFLEEEREREMDAAADAAMVEAANEAGADANGVALSSADSLKAGERIIEALQLCLDERDKAAAHAKSGQPASALPVNPMLLATNCADPESYVLRSLERVRSADLEAALLVIPFSYIPLLLELADLWAEREWNLAVTCRVLFFLLKVHHNQIVASRALRPRLVSLQHHVRAAVERQRDIIGCNMAAFRYLKREKEFLSSSSF